MRNASLFKKLVLGSCLAAFVLTFAFQPFAANAQVTPAPTTPAPTTPAVTNPAATTPASTVAPAANTGVNFGTAVNSALTNTAAALGYTPVGATISAAQTAANVAGTVSKCGGDLGCYLITSMVGIIAKIVYYLMIAVSWLLGIVGVLFNWLVVITIFQFAVFFGNSQGMLLAWGVLRDVGNILILFGFLYAGVMILLDLHSFDARKSIPLLIIFAILLNFSLFAGEAIVDVANVLSSQIYKQAGTSLFQPCSSLTACTNQVGIAEVIIQDTGVGSSFSFTQSGATQTNTTQVGNTDPTTSTDQTDQLHQLLAYIGVIILMSIVMMLLLTASIMLLMRAVTLVVLLVTSPIGFAGLAIPQLESQAQKWWQSLLSNAFFAPIFLLLLFVGLKVMDGLRQAMGGQNATLIAALSNPNVSIGSIFIIFGLLVGFFIAALMFAKSSGAAGAQFATSFAQKTVMGGWSKVGGAGQFAYGFAARNTVGRAGRAGARKYNETIGNLKGKKGFTGWAAKTVDYAVGDNVAGGLDGLSKKRFGNVSSLKESEDHQKHRDHITHDAAAKVDRGQERTNAYSMPRGAFVAGSNTVRDVNDPVEKARNKAIADAFAKSNKKEQQEVLAKMDEHFDDFVRNLKQSAYEEHVKDKEFDEHAREEMEHRRFNEINAPRVIQAASVNDVVKVPESALQKPANLKALLANQLAEFDPNKFKDPATEAAIVAYVNANRTDPEVMKFLGLVGKGGIPGTSRTNLVNRWSGVRF